MKRLLCVFLLLTAVLGLAACGTESRIDIVGKDSAVIYADTDDIITETDDETAAPVTTATPITTAPTTTATPITTAAETTATTITTVTETTATPVTTAETTVAPATTVADTTSAPATTAKPVTVSAPIVAVIPVTTAVTEVIKDNVKGTVYWVENGTVYHTNENCRSLSRSKNVLSGSINDCPKTKLCKICAEH